MPRYPLPYMEEPTRALQAFAERMAIAKAMQQANLVDRQVAMSLAEYISALQYLLLTPALTSSSWEKFLAGFKKPEVLDGIPRQADITIAPGPYLFAILPTNLNGTAWSADQIAQGLHFSLNEWIPEQQKTLTGDTFPQILPTEVLAIGSIQANSQDELIKGLESAFAALSALILQTKV